MRLESKKLLEDIRQASKCILDFTEGKIFGDYTEDEIVWDVVTRDLPTLHEQVEDLLRE